MDAQRAAKAWHRAESVASAEPESDASAEPEPDAEPCATPEPLVESDGMIRWRAVRADLELIG